MTEPVLATTSEGVWLAAAMAGVTWLPPALRIRPVRSVADTLADHPGLATLDKAGVIHNNELRPDVAEWLQILGRPDIEVDVLIDRPDEKPSELLGPSAVPSIAGGLEGSATALADWTNRQPAQRRVVLCRRGGVWAAAVRSWHPSRGLDEVAVTGLDEATLPPMLMFLGDKAPVRFPYINVAADPLNAALGAWQTNPDMAGLMALTRIGLSPPQIRIVEAVADAGTTRASISVAQYSIEGHTRAPGSVTVADTLLGRALIINTVPDVTSILPGNGEAIHTALTNLCDTLPCGWRTHQRIPERVPL